MIHPQKAGTRTLPGYAYGQLSGPLQRAHRRYETYLGRITSIAVAKQLPGYTPPPYVKSNNYTGAATHGADGGQQLLRSIPGQSENAFRHHLHPRHLFVLEQLKLS